MLCGDGMQKPLFGFGDVLVTFDSDHHRFPLVMVVRVYPDLRKYALRSYARYVNWEASMQQVEKDYVRLVDASKTPEEMMELLEEIQ